MENSDYYNESVLSYLRKCINIAANIKHENIIKKLANFIQEKSHVVLEKPITQIIYDENESNLFKCENKEIKPKSISTDELDNLTFIADGYNPYYCYYKNEEKNLFVINIVINGKVKCECKFYPKESQYTFIIEGEKMDNQKNKNKDMFYVMNIRKKYGKFKIVFTVNMEELNISILNNNHKKEIKNCMMIIEYTIG